MVVDIGEVKRHIKPKADSTLHNMRKADLIEYIRCLEHNYNVAVSFNENQAKYIEGLGVSLGWIPVSERMPTFEDFEGCDKDNCYITVKRWDYENGCYKSSVSYAHWTGDYFTYGGGITGGEIVGVTHWMPLPKPPTEV